MRKLGIAVLIFVVLLVTAALLVPRLVDINRYRSQIQAQLEKRLNRHVSLGEMGLSFFPPSFSVQNAVIAEAPGFGTGQAFATVERLYVSVKIWPLLRKEVDIKSLQLERPRIELIRNEQGIWNFASLGQEQSPIAEKPSNAPTPSAKGQEPSAPESSKPSAGQLSLAYLVIHDGQIAITDKQKREQRAVYDHIDLDLSDFAPDKPFSIRASLHLPGQGKQSISLQGRGGPVQQSDLIKTPFDGQLRLEQVAISAASRFLNSQALNGVDGLLSGQANLKNDAGRIASNGALRAESARIHNVDVGYPITLDYNVAHDLGNNTIQINKGDIKLGSTPVAIMGTVNGQSTPAQLDMHLKAANASISELARLASAFGVVFGAGTTVSGQVSANLQARGPANQPSLNGQLSARNLDISSKQISQAVKVPSVELVLTPDTIHSNDFTATAGSTSITGNFALTQYTAPTSSITATLRAPNAQIGELLNIAKAAGITAVEGVSGNGMLALDVRAQGPTKNMSALLFSGTGKIQNASLKLASLTKPLEIRNSDIHFSQNSVTLENVSAAIGQTNASGSLTLKDFAAPKVQFTLNADKVNVAEMQQIFSAVPASPARAASGQDFWTIIPQAQAQTNKREASTEPSAITKMTGTGTIGIGSIQYDNLLLTNAKSNVTLDHGLITMNPVTADLYGGKEAGNIVLDMRGAQPVYAVNLKTDKVDANKLLSSVSSVKEALYGLLNSDVNARFSATSAEAIAHGLNGKLGINLTNGKLMNVDLLHELAAVGKFLGNVPTSPKGFTNIAQLSGNFDVKNGVAETNDLKAMIDGGTMAAKGLVNLADQSLNLHVTAVLNKALSQQVGGNQIGGFMNTALANNQGELVLPVIVTGTFQHPQVAPDVQQMAQLKMQNLLPTSKNLGELLGNKNGQPGGITDVLGALGKKNQKQPSDQGADKNDQGADKNQDQEPQNPVGDVLNQVLGKKKKPTPTPPR